MDISIIFVMTYALKHHGIKGLSEELIMQYGILS